MHDTGSYWCTILLGMHPELGNLAGILLNEGYIGGHFHQAITSQTIPAFPNGIRRGSSLKIAQQVGSVEVNIFHLFITWTTRTIIYL